MKELSIEEKAKLYDEAYKKVAVRFGSNVADEIFPELKESEDEKIRKELIKFVKVNISDEERYIAWLEKQGEQKKSYDTCNSSMMDNKKSPYGEKRDFGYFEEKPADNVKPKFNEGDWIVENTDAWLITKVFTTEENITAYNMINQEGRTLVIGSHNIDYCYHLWSIADAKKGDVLLHNGCTFIFICIEKGVVKGLEENLCNGTEACNFGEPEYDNDYCPATKEQRDLLFQKMKEASYEWDAEKKELKKIEQKPAEWSEEDENNILFLTSIIEECFKNKEKITLHGDTVCAHFTKEDVIDRLKSLRPQNNITDEELAQAKKDAYNDALDKIEYHSGEPTFDDGWSAAIWYLKKRNTMPQSQWKPSEEQLKSLQEVIDTGHFTSYPNALETLYEQIKQL